MKLLPPFLISARLLPGLKIGDATLSLDGFQARGNRTSAVFVLDFADGSEYRDENLQSGMGGFGRNGPVVEAFETFLSFLSAAAEAKQYETRTGRTSDNGDMFPPHIMDWCADNASDIECVHCDLRDEEGNIRAELITD